MLFINSRRPYTQGHSELLPPPENNTRLGRCVLLYRWQNLKTATCLAHGNLPRPRAHPGLPLSHPSPLPSHSIPVLGAAAVKAACGVWGDCRFEPQPCLLPCASLPPRLPPSHIRPTCSPCRRFPGYCHLRRLWCYSTHQRCSELQSVFHLLVTICTCRSTLRNCSKLGPHWLDTYTLN